MKSNKIFLFLRSLIDILVVVISSIVLLVVLGTSIVYFFLRYFAGSLALLYIFVITIYRVFFKEYSEGEIDE